MDSSATFGCGDLVIGGFTGTSLPPAFARALSTGRRGGAILFKPNVAGGIHQTAALCRAIHAASAAPLIGIDQEGGRVARLGAPLLRVPPMRALVSLAAAGSNASGVAFATRVARAVGRELAAIGFTLDFAPVLDVNTCAHNPVIGDRAFGDDADTCSRYGVAWIHGLQEAGLLACGKHFPGHGDTSVDSHLDLPVVTQPLDRIERVELAPFRAAAEAGVATMMTAHVVYEAIDPARPATLSPAVCTALRDRVGFRGVLISDDLEMKAIAARWSIEDSAVQAIAAGCDALLVCWSDDLQERAVEALDREAERSPAFRARCREARARLVEARRRIAVHPLDDAAIDYVIGGGESRAVAEAIAARSGGAPS